MDTNVSPAPTGAYLVDPDGRPVRVPIEEAQGLLDGGWTPATPEQAEAVKQERALQAEHGGLGSQVITGLEGAAQSLTLGGSTYIEKALGVDPEGIAAREKANPSAHLTGEVVGVAAPILATMGGAAPAVAGAKGAASAAKGIASATAPSLIGKAGGAVAKAAGKLLPKATGALGQAAVKTATGAAQGLTEGALFGVGQVVHESALGDPKLTAQSAVDTIGLSALLGGGLGGTGGALAGLAKGGAKAVSGTRLGEKLAGWLQDFEGTRNLKAAGAIQSDLKSAAKRMSREELSKIGREAGEMGLVGPFSTPAATLEKATLAMESAGRKMGNILDAADGLPSAAPRSVERLYKRVSEEVLKPLEKNPLEAGTAAELGKFMEGYRAQFAVDGLRFADLHGIRKQLDAKLYGLRGVADPNATALKSALHDFRTIVSDELEQGLAATKLGKSEWKQAAREYRVAATVARMAEAGVDRASGNNPLGLLSVMSGLTGFATHGVPGGAGLALGAELLKRYGSGVAGAGARMLRGSEAFGALTQLARANAETTEKVAELAGRLVAGGRAVAAPRVAREAVEDRIAQVQQFANNPALAMDALAQGTGDVAEHAPEVAQAMQVTAARAAAFLASKVPQQPMTGPLGPKLELSEQAKWQFARYDAAIQRPTSILELAESGTLTPLDVEAVQVVYPELFLQMQTAALQQVVEAKGKVPYQSRLMLALLLGRDVDGTMTKEAIQANQAAYARPSQKDPMNQPGGAPVRPSQTGLSKLKTASRAMTPDQSADARLEAP